ncbi:MAG: alpha/beta hydrolase [Gammaproteobacteria bacterium]|jgi:proline iminopeptidase|nr:alpha/beta hydrolase [Gammaproteobacteria bacterium]MBT7533711.1 alpha/beta hydrolase [Gammaproteobacteria bacterium]MBT7877080.1 alpha/beta hydrolase [Gammaproteobacteria bacterium]
MKKILFLVSLLSTFCFAADQEDRISELNGINIWWQDHGDSNNPAVLLIMGLNSNSKVWSETFVQSIVDEGFYVIIFDNRDTGKSTWVTDEPALISFIKVLPTFLIEAFVDGIFTFIFDEEGRFNMANPAPAEYNLNDMALDGLSLLDHLEIEQAHIVGASMGGMIAQVMALNYPERVLTLTAIMSTPGFDTVGLSGPHQKFVDAMRESMVLNLLEQEKDALVVIEKALTGSRFPFDERLFTKEAKKRIQQGLNTSNAQIAAVGASPNRFDRLKEIQIPTLIVHGTEDPLIPIDHGLSLADNIPNASKMFMQGVGHEIPEELVPIIATKLKTHFDQAGY